MSHALISAEDISRTAFFTGHRMIPAEQSELLGDRVFICIYDAYHAGYRRFFCGCALGFDTMAAFQTVRLRNLFPDVKLSLAIPCETQSDKWPEKDKKRYREILDLSDDQIVLSPEYYQGVMLVRNRYMADRSSLCICYLTHMRGGTASTVRYALTCDPMNIINLAVISNDYHMDLMREDEWKYMCISPSASKNADTVHLYLRSDRKLTMKTILRSF